MHVAKAAESTFVKAPTKVGLTIGTMKKAKEIIDIVKESYDATLAIDAAKSSGNRVVQKLEAQIKRLNSSLHLYPDC